MQNKLSAILGGSSKVFNFHDMSSLRFLLQAELQLFLHILPQFDYSMWSQQEDFLPWSRICFLAGILAYYIINRFKDSTGETQQSKRGCCICCFQ